MLDRSSFLAGAALGAIFSFAMTEAWASGNISQAWMWAAMGLFVIVGGILTVKYLD